MTIHQYDLKIRWIGNTGEGTQTYQSYQRDFVVESKNKPAIPGSADPLIVERLADGIRKI